MFYNANLHQVEPEYSDYPQETAETNYPSRIPSEPQYPSKQHLVDSKQHLVDQYPSKQHLVDNMMYSTDSLARLSQDHQDHLGKLYK